MKDYYKILELTKAATEADIKKSFRRLSKVAHPDKGGNHETFTDINEAYQTLSDKEKRKAYDSGGKYIAPQKPVINDIQVQINWTLDDVKKGKTINVTVNRVIICTTCHGVGSKNAAAITTCSHCHGAGKFVRQEKTPFGFMMMEHTCESCMGTGEHNTEPCPTCRGQKMMNVTEQESVIIPPSTIEFYSKLDAGHKTIHGNSNLIVLLALKDEGVYSNSAGLYKEIVVNAFDALLGKEQMVTIKGTTLKVTIPKDAKHAQAFKLTKAYCGIDLIVRIMIPLPSIKQTKDFVLDLFKEDKEILSAVTKRVNETFK